MPDRIGSVGGHVVMIANRKTEKACVLGWRSKQLRRVVHSSLAAEALAHLELLGDIKYTRDMLQQMFGKQALEIPCINVTDSKNLWEAVHSLKSVDDRRLTGTIAEIKEAMLEMGPIELRHLPGDCMLADGLTKKGGNSEELMLLLRTGRFELKGGWEINSRIADIERRTWMDLNREKADDDEF